ncbi:deacetoxyvindoline 4-hydroxylase-like [Coffea arabica]|uniref:Deacetoxyvindoline 4-hydroxylase-like n=1 Tax=Coffea arabica TaxID=13443 RepID=A0A6P6WSV0_COFAR|nr:deacetoxyvindoline 4-hydroxylase-like [Coffea arabica]
MEKSCVKEIATQMASADGDRFKDLKAFDDTKADVKGLVDAGIARLPKIFIQPAEELINGLNNCHLEVQLPIIDLSEIRSEDNSKSVLAQIKQAREEWRFFQVTNHWIPQNVLDRMIEGIRKFHLLHQYCSRDRLRTCQNDEDCPS